MSMYSFIGFMAIIIFATILACGYAILKRIDEIDEKRKPSEDEERLINTSISFLKDFADKEYENAVECIDWLKSKLNGNSGK